MKIKKAQYQLSSPDFAKCPAPDRPEYAFIGRSNVGKSSLINMLCQNDKLARTSGTPGKTQLINHYDILSIADSPGAPESRWYLVDLPGYGFAQVSQRSRRRWEQMIENYLRNRENLLQVFVLIDARHPPQKIDLEFLQKMQLWDIEVTLVFTKTDKVNQSTAHQHMAQMMEKLKETRQFLPRHILTSALKGTGRDKILGLIEEINSSQEHQRHP